MLLLYVPRAYECIKIVSARHPLSTLLFFHQFLELLISLPCYKRLQPRTLAVSLYQLSVQRSVSVTTEIREHGRSIIPPLVGIVKPNKHTISIRLTST